MKLLSLMLMASFGFSLSVLADPYPGSDLSQFIQHRMRNDSNSSYAAPNGINRVNRDGVEKKILGEFLRGRDYKANPRLAVEDARTLVSFSEKMFLAIEGDLPQFEEALRTVRDRPEYVARYVSPHVFTDLLKEHVLNDQVLDRLPSNPFADRHSAAATNLIGELKDLATQGERTLRLCGPRLNTPRWKQNHAHFFETARALERKTVSARRNSAEIASGAAAEAISAGGRATQNGTKRPVGYNSYVELTEALERLSPDPVKARLGDEVAHAMNELVVELFFEAADGDLQAIHPELLESASGKPLDHWVFRNAEGEWRVNSAALAESEFRDWVVIQLDRLFRTGVAQGEQADIVEHTLGSLKLDWKRYTQEVSEQFDTPELRGFLSAFEANKSHVAAFQNEISSADFLADFRRLALLDILGISASPNAVAKRISGLPTNEVRKALLFAWNSGDSIARAGMVQLFRDVLDDGATERTLKATQGLASLMNDPDQASQLFTDVARKLGGRISQSPEIAAEFQGVVKYLFHEGGVRTECSVWLN